MNGVISSFRLEPKRPERFGQWFYFKRGMRLRLAAYGSREFALHTSKLIRANEEHLGRRIGDEEAAILSQIERDALAVTVVLEWENFYDATGRPLVCSPAVVFDAMESDPDLHRFVVATSRTLPMD